MGGSRGVLAGPQIAAGRAGLGGIGPGSLVVGVREHCRFATSVATGCQRELRLGVGVVDPRAKRRFWD